MKKFYLFGLVFLLTLALATSVSAINLTDGLVAYYKLDENTGTTASDSVVSNDLTFTGSSGLWTTGKINNAAFSGSTPLRATSSNNIGIYGTSERTMSFWIRGVDTTFFNYIIGFGEGEGTGSRFFINGNVNNNRQLWFGGQGVDFSLNVLYSQDTWTHVTVVYTGTHFLSYQNGVHKLTREQSINTVNSPLSLFSYFGSLTTSNMYLDEVGIWNRALSSAEIEALYDAQKDGFETGQYPTFGEEPSELRNATITAQDITNSLSLTNFTLSLNGTLFSTTNGSVIVEINTSQLYELTFSTVGFVLSNYQNVNLSTNFQANLTQFNSIGARDIYTNQTINLTPSEVVVAGSVVKKIDSFENGSDGWSNSIGDAVRLTNWATDGIYSTRIQSSFSQFENRFITKTVDLTNISYIVFDINSAINEGSFSVSIDGINQWSTSSSGEFLNIIIDTTLFSGEKAITFSTSHTGFVSTAVNIDNIQYLEDEILFIPGSQIQNANVSRVYYEPTDLTYVLINKSNNYFYDSRTTNQTITNPFIADLTPLPLEEFNFVNLDNTFVNNTYQINWTESVSPSGKAVTYNVLIYNQTSLVINTTTSDLTYTFNMASLPSNRFNVTIIARETGTPQTETISSFLYLNKINELYFKELKSSSPLENATITIRFPTGTTTQYVTNSLGRIQFPSFEGTTLLIGSYNITFEDYAGFQSPVTFNPTYSSLPINQTYNITITNIIVNLYDVEKNALITQYAEVVFSNLFVKNTSNGTIFIEDATIVAGQYSVYVDSEGYQLTQKVFTYTSQDSVEISIYLLNESSPVAGNLFVTVYDNTFYKQLGADVRLQAYFPNVNDFTEVGQCFTDSNGECVFGIELGEKLYRVVATKEINGITYTAQSSPSGVFYQVDNTQVELYLITSGVITIDDDTFLRVQSFDTELNDENLTIYTTFQGTDGLDYTVCQRLKLKEDFVETILYSSCSTGSSGTVGFNDTILLNLSKSYIVDVYSVKNSNIWKIYGTYYYLGAESFQSSFQTYITVIIAFSLAGLLAISRWLKNVNIFFMGLIGATFIYVTSVPSYISLAYGGVIVVFSVMNMYISRKRSDNETS